MASPRLLEVILQLPVEIKMSKLNLISLSKSKNAALLVNFLQEKLTPLSASVSYVFLEAIG